MRALAEPWKNIGFIDIGLLISAKNVRIRDFQSSKQFTWVFAITDGQVATEVFNSGRASHDGKCNNVNRNFVILSFCTVAFISGSILVLQFIAKVEYLFNDLAFSDNSVVLSYEDVPWADSDALESYMYSIINCGDT